MTTDGLPLSAWVPSKIITIEAALTAYLAGARTHFALGT
jgi:hypothetical protein